MSSNTENKPNLPKIDFIIPESGKLFYEQNSEFLFCKPQLMPLKSVTLEKLEKMQKQAREQMQENRGRTAAARQF